MIIRKMNATDLAIARDLAEPILSLYIGRSSPNTPQAHALIAIRSDHDKSFRPYFHDPQMLIRGFRQAADDLEKLYANRPRR